VQVLDEVVRAGAAVAADQHPDRASTGSWANASVSTVM